jgi:hypothetical protein
VAQRHLALAQVFSTTLSDRAGGAQLGFITVPSRSWDNPPSPPLAESVVRSLELSNVRSIQSEFEIVELFHRALSAEYDYFDAAHGTPGPAAASRLLNQFVEQAVFTDVVPFEESPLELTSIAALIKQATGVGLGAYVGFLVAGGPTPLLFLTIPAGMVIMGTASGVAKALEVGLNYRLLRLMGVPISHQEPPPVRKGRRR